MFTIIISEKGGAERRETFDKNEINVGRVQGNDLMLPKGNVSKHHARLLYRDGRFIVTDLKSTNGTYVNGRKIAQATIVREGDKIYIGDFVLKLDTGVAAASQPSNAAGGEPEAYRPQDDPNAGRQPPRMPQPAPNTSPPIQPAPVHMASQQMQQHPPGMPPIPPPLVQGQAQQQVSHYPLERDPDDSESSPNQGQSPGKVPPAPRVPQMQQDGRQRPNSTAIQPNRPQAQAAGREAAQATPAAPQAQQQQPQRQPQAPAPSPASMPPRQLPRETPAQAGRRLALITLVDRVADVVDIAPLKQSPDVDDQLSAALDRAVREQAKAMRDEGEAPEGTDVEVLVRDALRELVGLGPVGPLLEDDECSEIHCMRHDYVLAIRGGQAALADASFTSEEALYRTITRLAHQSGVEWRSGEFVIERRLARGATMIAITPPAASGCVLVIRKRRRVESSLEDLVRSGALSRPMASFLEHCVTARANILVCGSGSATVGAVLVALASAGPAGDRVAVLQDTDELAVAQAHVVSLALPDHRERGEEAVRAAGRLRADRLIVGNLAGSVVPATLDTIAEGAEGVMAGVCASSLRQGLARVASQLAVARPGVTIDGAREALGESFDVAVEVTRLPDGRLRVLRVSELSGGDGKGVGVRDLFTLSAEGAAGGEGAFVASGIVPRFVADFAARGVRVDANLFKRTVGRN